MKKNPVFIILGTLFGLNILAWIAIDGLSQPRGLEVTFFDVGQGDAIFIETPQRHQILIDGGPDSTILEKLGKEMPFWDRSLDLIILTHPDTDHLMGLIEVLKRYQVEKILWTGVFKDTPEYQEWRAAIKKEKVTIFIARTPQKIYCSRLNLEQCYLEVLWPNKILEGKEIEKDDNTSIVMKLNFGQISFLFTGDIYKSVEDELIKLGFDLDSDILKISHHGSKTSTSKEFVKKVKPQLAIISLAKDNPYGHPHQKVLENLKGIKVLRTDFEGDIKIISDGVKFKIKSGQF